jgi:hypothetical protein
VTRHDCLPSLLNDGDKLIEIVYEYGGDKTILYWTNEASQGRTKFSCTGIKRPTNQPRNVPICLSFNSRLSDYRFPKAPNIMRELPFCECVLERLADE